MPRKPKQQTEAKTKAEPAEVRLARVKHSRSGRPMTWPTQIEAPREALDLYELIASLQESDAFDTCHLWSGAMNGAQPVIKWRKKNKGVVQVLAGYLGTPSSRNTCGTKNCVNPFHHLPYATPEPQMMEHITRPETVEYVNAGIEDYMELVEDAIGRAALKKDEITFENLRGYLDPDDISDSYLRDCINKLASHTAK